MTKLSLWRALLVACVLAVSLSCVSAVIFDFDDETINQYRIFRVGMYAPADAPSKQNPGNGDSYVQAKLTFEAQPLEFRETPDVFLRDKYAYLAVFHSMHWNNVGELNADTRLYTRHYCAPDGTFLSSVDRAKYPSTFSLTEIPLLGPNNASTVDVDVRFNIDTSGVYYTLLTVCGLEPRAVSVSGELTMMNPYGHLPGGYFGMLPFYGVMLSLLMVCALPWIFLIMRYIRELLRVQHAMSMMLGLAVLEAIVFLSYYANFNIEGRRNSASLIIAIIVSLVRKTMSRVLVLAVSFGFGVVRPTLGKTMNKIFAAALVYFVAAGALEVAQSMYQAGQLSLDVATFFALPVAILDALFYLITFKALQETMADIRARRQVEKQRLYRRFIGVLIAYVCVSVFWLLFQTFWVASDAYEVFWQWQWTMDAYWFLVFALVFGAMMFLWRPTSNNTRYAFALDLSMLDELDDEQLSQVEAATGELYSGSIRTRPVPADRGPLSRSPGRASPSQDASRPQEPVPKVHPLTNFALDDGEEEAVELQPLAAGSSSDAGGAMAFRQQSQAEEEEEAEQPLLHR